MWWKIVAFLWLFPMGVYYVYKWLTSRNQIIPDRISVHVPNWFMGIGGFFAIIMAFALFFI